MSGLADVFKAAKAFETEANLIFASSDDVVRPRVFTASAALNKVSKLSSKQSDLLKQAVRCIEHEIYRAAIVMAWAGVADLVLELAEKERAAVLSVRQRWTFSDKASLAETQGDHSIIEALRAASLLTKGQMKSLHAMLHKRNECAHPSDYYPGPNEALGYIDESIAMVKLLQKKI